MFWIFLFISLPSHASIKKDWGISYDDYISQKFNQFQFEFQDFKNENAVQLIEQGTIYTNKPFFEDPTQTFIFFDSLNERTGTLFIKSPQKKIEYFIRIEKSLSPINITEFEQFKLPRPQLGEVIHYNFNNVFRVVWKNLVNKKFVSITVQDLFVVRFVLKENSKYEVYSIDTNLNRIESQFWGEVVQEKNPLLPIQSTDFKIYLANKQAEKFGFSLVSFFKFNQLYNDLVIGLLDRFSFNLSPFSSSIDSGEENQSVNIKVGN